MTSFFDKLNLRAGERRLVVIVGLVVFLLVNIWFVRPYFSEWGKTQAAIAAANANLEKAKKKIAAAKGPQGYEAQLRNLESQGETIAADEQDIQLLRTVMNQVGESKISVTQYGTVQKSAVTATNEFFEEQSMKISISGGEKELVDFLVNIGSGNSMIRVRDMDLRPPDATRMRLAGSITLVASYQKKSPAAPAAAKPAAPGSRQTVAPAPRPTNSPSARTNAPPARKTNAPVTPRRT